MRQALVESRNVPAVKTFQSVDNEKIKDFVTKLGLHPELNPNNGKIYEAEAIGGYNGEYPLSVAELIQHLRMVDIISNHIR